LVEVGVVSVLNDKDEEAKTGSVAYGIFLLFLGQCATGAMFVTEEKFLHGY